MTGCRRRPAARGHHGRREHAEQQDRRDGGAHSRDAGDRGRAGLRKIGSRLSALGSRLSALGSRLSALGSRLSALGSRLSALGSRLSALGFAPAPTRRSRPRAGLRVQGLGFRYRGREPARRSSTHNPRPRTPSCWPRAESREPRRCPPPRSRHDPGGYAAPAPATLAVAASTAAPTKRLSSAGKKCGACAATGSPSGSRAPMRRKQPGIRSR